MKLKAFKEYELDAVNKVADQYTELLKDIVKTPVVPSKMYSSWAQYTLQLDSEEERDALQALFKRPRNSNNGLLSKTDAQQQLLQEIKNMWSVRLQKNYVKQSCLFRCIHI